ncbi:MAG TPA: DUF2973 domain-containing protein [Cyanobacteria bacterium UBA8156]|jgi:hypothetical protein|nr:DUF2973 domain-containing protein [Cyanobacteria bacterium UBA8156]
MLQILYITAFALLSLLAIANLIRSMAALARTEGQAGRRDYRRMHPELLDEAGKPTREPLLVMKALDLDEARAQLDRMFEASPGSDS